MRAGERTDMTKLTGAFRDYANTSKKKECTDIWSTVYISLTGSNVSLLKSVAVPLHVEVLDDELPYTTPQWMITVLQGIGAWECKEKMKLEWVGNSVEIDRIKLAIKKYRSGDREKGQWVSEEQKERQIKRRC